jgi:hypothetical protein
MHTTFWLENLRGRDDLENERIMCGRAEIKP